ncbi:acyltransferase family protein [Morganella morganii]|uniref:acyltransferase n=1 Tax=Morganella morganii TaxID=582 RepID=UPI003EB8A958
MVNNKVNYIDSIRAYGAIAVILIHVSGYYLSYTPFTNTLNWNIANIVDSMSRFAVPIFYMISGFIFFNDKSPTIKNFIKITGAILFYSVFSLIIIKAITFNYGFEPYPKYKDIFKSPAYYHLWFMYPLIGIYIISMIVKIKNISCTKGVVISLFLFIFFNKNAAEQLLLLFDINYYFYFMFDGDFIFYLLYAVVGGFLRNVDTKNKYIYLCVYIVSTISIAVVISLNYESKSNIQSLLYGYNTPLVFISAVSLFLFAKKSNKSGKVTSFISKHSLGIYGFHAPILMAIQVVFPYSKLTPLIGIPVVSLILMAICITLSSITIYFDKNRFVS